MINEITLLCDNCPCLNYSHELTFTSTIRYDMKHKILFRYSYPNLIKFAFPMEILT